VAEDTPIVARLVTRARSDRIAITPPNTRHGSGWPAGTTHVVTGAPPWYRFRPMRTEGAGYVTPGSVGQGHGQDKGHRHRHRRRGHGHTHWHGQHRNGHRLVGSHGVIRRAIRSRIGKVLLVALVIGASLGAGYLASFWQPGLEQSE
jgi:hypothetical protein